MAYDSKYAIELWSATGQLLADFSGRARNRNFIISRNEAESISWDLDLNDFEAYCRSVNISPTLILQPGVTEVRLRRAGTYLIGGKINFATPTIDSNTQRINISASGFLNLFKDRYTPVYRRYLATQATTIASSLINDSQNGGNLITNNSFETDLSGWSASGCSITRVSTQAYIGSNSMQVGYTATGQYAAFTYSSFDVDQSYQGGAWVLVPVGNQVSINITSNGGLGSTSLTYTGTGAWQFMTTNPQPPGATSGTLQIVSVTGGTYNIYVDAAILAVTDALVSPVIGGVSVLDFGVTIGSLATVGLHDRIYKRTNIKEALVALTQVQTAAFDFEFTYDKTFITYAAIGTTRNDITFEYPRNIKAVSFDIDATQMGNQIIGLGSGNGTTSQLVVAANDIASQQTYKVRQRVYNSSATDNTDSGLTDGMNVELSKWANPIRLLNLTIDGNVAPYVTDYKIGDRVKVNITNYATFSQINGMYRIEKISVTIDEDDNEEIVLTVSA